VTTASRLDEASCQQVCQQTFLAGYQLVEQTGSTNDDSLAMIRAGQLDQLPWLLIANRQLAGRGRQSARWWSAPGALTFSLLLDWDSAGSTALLALACGLATCRAVEAACPSLPDRLSLKWPNDVYFGTRKLAGILIETPAAGSPVVVGIGLNVNNSIEQGPPELADQATALVDIIGTTIPLADVLTGVLREIELLLGPLRTNPAAITDPWQSRCMLNGMRIGLRQGNLQVQGICQGIDSQGRLLLAGPDQPGCYAAGSVEWYEPPQPEGS
jgi:BirA family biotin operon repressor/biotin-[acetyl-CoA-carboxylase] ligase